MKKKKNAQISIEYLTIFAITVIILIPTVILFKNFASSSGDEVVSQKLREISNKIIDTARQVHYYGPPSKKVIQIDMPQNVNLMGILTDAINGEYIIAFRISGSEGDYHIYYDSNIPLVEHNFGSNEDYPENCNELHEECSLSFECFCFPIKDFSSGPKLISIESSDDDFICSSDVSFCVKLDEISDQLSIS